jgi:hypothetical protein
MEKISENILNVFRIPPEFLKVNNNNVSNIKIQNEWFKKVIDNKLNEILRR